MTTYLLGFMLCVSCVLCVPSAQHTRHDDTAKNVGNVSQANTIEKSLAKQPVQCGDLLSGSAKKENHMIIDRKNLCRAKRTAKEVQLPKVQKGKQIAAEVICKAYRFNNVGNAPVICVSFARYAEADSHVFGLRLRTIHTNRYAKAQESQNIFTPEESNIMTSSAISLPRTASENRFSPSWRGAQAHDTTAYEFFQDLLKAKAHLGTNTWTKDVSKFLLGSRNGISIFNIEHTLISLRQVLKFLETSQRIAGDSPCYPARYGREAHASRQNDDNVKSALRKPHILFVNTHTKYSELVKQTAIQSNQSYINERWIGGTLTNWKQISESIMLYNKFHKQFDQFLKINNIQIPIYQKAKKRYQGLKLQSDWNLKSMIHESTESAEKHIYMSCASRRDNAKRKSEKNNLSPVARNVISSSILASSFIPDIIVITNPDQNILVIKEAQLFKIPVIAFVDTNTKTSGIDYVIPGNNKSIYFMYFCLNLITITLQRSN